MMVTPMTTRASLASDNVAGLCPEALGAMLKANAVASAMVNGLRQRGWAFHHFAQAGGYRLMTAWDTTPATIEAFAADAKASVLA